MSTNYLLQAKGLELDDIITLTARSDQSFISKQIIARDNGTYDVGFIITEREKILELLSAQPTEDGAKKVLTTRPVIKKTKKGKDKQETLPVVRLGNVFSSEPIVNETFSCLVIGRVPWIENSVYGNRVPDGQENSDVRFSTNDAEKAVIKITLESEWSKKTYPLSKMLSTEVTISFQIRRSTQHSRITPCSETPR